MGQSAGRARGVTARRSQSRGSGAGSQRPARVPCVQRQKMVSERPGQLLVPHTSSTSSLVNSDMMGYRRTGLCFQDSCPGTWGGTAPETGVAGRQRQSSGKVRRDEDERRELQTGSAPVKPTPVAAKFRVPEVPGPPTSGFPLLPPHP